MGIKLNKRVKGTIFVAIVATIVIVISSVIYLVSLKSELEDGIILRLEEAGEQNALFLGKEIESKQNVLTEVLCGINDIPLEELVETLKSVVDKYDFIRMGVILPDGTAITTDDADMYLGDRDFFVRAMRGEVVISDTLSDKTDGKPINVYAVPVQGSDGEVRAVMFATYSTENFAHTLDVPLFDGAGISYVIKTNGTLIVTSGSIERGNSSEDFYSFAVQTDERNVQTITDFKATVANGESGHMEIYESGKKYVYFCPLDINDWYLMTVVPSEVLDESMNSIMVRTYIVLIVFLIVSITLMMINMRVEHNRHEDLLKLVYVDELTGGYTYTKFCIEAERILNETHDKSVILSLDVNDFKLINNLYGYDIGNVLIKFIYDKIKVNLNISYQNEIIAHQSADKYVILMHYRTKTELEKRLLEISRELTEYYLENKRYHLRTVIGVYSVEGQKLDIRLMVDCAAIARKSIKGSSHENFFAYYDEGVKNQLVKDRNIESEMGDALKNKEFVVYYQPKYSTTDKRVVGAEALVRWRKPNGSFVLPRDFIPLFESNGFVTTLDKYMFKEVCAAQRRWLDRGFTPVPVSVNLSRLHLHSMQFIADYQKILYDNGIPPYYVQLEITESAIFENPEILKEVIEKLHEIGISILMDDFGTGYSSMLMLKDIDIDVLKLDKSFVDDIGNERGEKIINAILRLTQSLDIEVTAEGVENKKQFDFLKEYECDNVQGFYFAAPMPEYEFEKLLLKERL